MHVIESMPVPTGAMRSTPVFGAPLPVSVRPVTLAFAVGHAWHNGQGLASANPFL